MCPWTEIIVPISTGWVSIFCGIMAMGQVGYDDGEIMLERLV